MRVLAGALVLAVFVLAQCVAAGVFVAAWHLTGWLDEDARIVVTAPVGVLSAVAGVWLTFSALRLIPRLINKLSR